LEILQSEAEKLQKELDEHLKRIENDSAEFSNVREQRDNLHQSMQDARITLLNSENRADNIKLQIKTSEDTLKEIQGRKKSIGIELTELNMLIEKRNTEISRFSKELDALKNTIQSNKSKLELLQDVLNDSFRQIEALQSEIKSKQHARENILESVKKYEIQISEFEQEIKFHRDRIQERYESEIPEVDEVSADSEELDNEIAKITRSIEKIGPINMAVQMEYEEEVKRLELLQTQKDDLIKSEENLRETIEKIDNIARNQLKDSFDQIKKNFENLFTLFFEGGHGSISFIGDPDPLEAEIAIHAQPPGKRNQAVRVLSAGEKSLTAIALLFAIYQYKPSPYCILDEVDAPLDDVNIKKFTRVLTNFQDETQFIVVTHNKLTMEAADYLYGVTMEQKGISKLVSVSFDD
jgi:chromosome segregation protein